jgi:hypothetical protein
LVAAPVVHISFLPCLSKQLLTSHNSNAQLTWPTTQVMLPSTISWPASFGAKPPSGAQVPILCYCKTFAGLLMWDSLFDERTGLQFTIAAGCRHRSYSRPQVSRDSKHILLSPFPNSSNLEHQFPKTSVPLLCFLSLPGKQLVHRAVP